MTGLLCDQRVVCVRATSFGVPDLGPASSNEGAGEVWGLTGRVKWGAFER